MTEQTEPIEQQPEAPRLRDRTVKPEGTIPKQAQTYVIVGVSIVIVLAVLFSNKHAQPAAKNQPKESTVVITEGNDRKISDFGQEMTNEQRAAQKAQLEKQMQAQARNLESASVMQPGDTRQFVGPQYAGSAQNAPATPPPDPIVQHERELAYNSRFASNFAFSTERVSAEAKGISPPQQTGAAPVWPEAMSGNAPGPSPTPAPGQPAELTFKLRPGVIYTGKVESVLQAISTGQTQTSGLAVTPKGVQSMPFVVRVKLDDEDVSKRLPAGSAGTAAIFTEAVKATHVIRKVLLRQLAILNYVNPF